MGRPTIPEMKERPNAKPDMTAIDTSQLPRDLGLFEGEKTFHIHAQTQTCVDSTAGTFIMPTGQNRPSIFSSPRRRLKLWWIRMQNLFGGYAGLVIYKTIGKPRIKLRLRKTAPAALKLHKEMYMAFADGDIATLRTICSEGLLRSFISRIQARRPSERYVWQLHKYTKFARVVSNRAVRLPFEDAGQRQAVVRIQSRQSLTKYDDVGRVVSGSGAEKEVREYVVIQKRVMDGKEGAWWVWGTTEETTLEEMERRERRRRGEE
ncbi:MAG: hypothetical protein M1816_000740 [Peltula sp. TS41687]|nr:MAG: hypothetical protein M1816_000740 [Peltula sp. TS41687]